jgi:hypothetical protein
MTSFCPYCSAPAEDAWSEIQHMEARHPDIIAERLRGVPEGFPKDVRFVGIRDPKGMDFRTGATGRWDVRIPADEFDRLSGEMAIGFGLRTISFKVPAAAPEIQLTFEGHESKDALVAVLNHAGFTVLAVRAAR